MFIFSKLLSAITQPMFWLVLWWALALMVLTRWRRPAVIMLWSGLVVLGLGLLWRWGYHGFRRGPTP